MTNGYKRGDTLVEVALAIGVISFIIISVASTMLTTLAASQTNLEETMAQAEIDIQAEALRFVHDTYAAQRKYADSNQQYAALWHAITAMAITPDQLSTLNETESCYRFYEQNASAEYSIYNNDERSFLLNTHRLKVGSGVILPVDGVLISSVTTDYNASIFRPAALHPRTLFGGLGDADTVIQGDSDIATNLALAEGVWVTAVCSDTVAGGTQCAPRPQYWDFYIRTCWDSSTAHITATKGTIVRLHNPDLLTTDVSGAVTDTGVLQYAINYEGAPGGRFTDVGSCTMDAYGYCNIRIGRTLDDYASKKFRGWSLTEPTETNPSPVITHSVTLSRSQPEVTLYAVWANAPQIIFKSNTGDIVYDMPETVNATLSDLTGRYWAVVPRLTPLRANYTFLGWSTRADSRVGETAYDRGKTLTMTGSITLYAIWKLTPRIYFNANASSTVTGLPDTVVGTITGVGSNTFRATIPAQRPKRPHYVFLGYATSPSAATGDPAYAPGTTLTLNDSITLYAIWEFVTYADWAIVMSWTYGYNDFDSHTYVCSGGSCGGPVYYASKNGTYYGTRVALDRDDTRYPGKETTSLESIGNNSVTFCVHAYNGATTYSNTDLKIQVYDVNEGNTWTVTPTYGAYGGYWTALRIYQGQVTTIQSFGGCSPR